ncbi:MAG: von Willebrand factor type A domain-containing protein [Phycisphaerae bacterium]|nr:von Willebrand factor type A domain-containing protein [Phycisphaerae bacterium]
MNREKAEKLLAALIFDDLDEASKADLLTYLQTDDELRERLADMRMAAKVASDTLHHGPDPTLGKKRLKRLARIAGRRSTGPTIFKMRHLAAAAAIVVAALLPALVIFSSLNSARKHPPALAQVLEKAESDTSELYGRALRVASRPTQSSGGGVYAFSIEDPAPKDSPAGTAGPTIVANTFFSGDDEPGKILADELLAQSNALWYVTGPGHQSPSDDSYTTYASAAELPSQTWESQPSTTESRGRTYSFSPPESTVALYNGAWADFDLGNESVQLDTGGSISTTDGRVMTFQGGDTIELAPTEVTGLVSAGEYQPDKPALPDESYLPTIVTAKPEAWAALTDAAADESPDQSRPHLTLGNDYGYLDGQKLDLGTEGEVLDREKIQSFASTYGAARQHGLRNELSKEEEAPTSGNAPEKYDPTSGAPDEKSLPAVARMGMGRSGSERSATDADFEFDITNEKDKVRAVLGEPPLGDVPISGNFFLSQGGKEALPEEHAKRQVDATFDYVKLQPKGEPEGVKAGVESMSDATAPATGLIEERFRDSLNSLSVSADMLKVLAGSRLEKEGLNVVGGDDMFVDAGKSYYINKNLLDKKSPQADTDRDKLVQALIAIESARRKPSPRSESRGLISQPEGKPVQMECEIINLRYIDPRQVKDSVADGFRDLQQTQSSPRVLIEPLTENRQIIVFGSKDMREKVKKMVQEIDMPPAQSPADRTSEPGAEDVTDLPESARFKLVPVNPWVMTQRDSLSTFALDVDTASYTLCRRYIRGGFLPPPGAVRMEEFINYFNYDYPQRPNPTFAVHAQAARSPFARKGQDLTLLKIGVKARTIGRDQRKAAHLIIVVDASASMDQPDRLPLVQKALGMLVDKLSPADRVSLITCANEARLHLEAVSARRPKKIRQAIDAVQPAGPTNLLAGLKLGYATARRKFDPKQINHVVLCSDGVANVGQTEAEAVLKEVSADRKQGIAITCVGVGYGSYNDAFLEGLANRGDGSYVFLDSARQARRVFVEQLAATLHTVAKDARIQVQFDPKLVRRYRLIGYENRDIEDKRFRDDTVDAGEVGSGQCSTALYELELTGRPSANRQEDLGTVFVRYRNADTGQIEEISENLNCTVVRRLTVESAPRFFLAVAAARFAEILRESEHAQPAGLKDVLRVAEQVTLALPLDRDVRGLAELIRKADNLPKAP